MSAPSPSAPELSVSESPIDQTIDDNNDPELEEIKVGVNGCKREGHVAKCKRMQERGSRGKV